MGKSLLRRHASALFDVLALLLTALTAHAAWAVTYQYDSQNRLIRAAYQNGTVIEYAYDSTGNRLQKKIRSILPPEVSLNTATGPFGPQTWNNNHAISGSATDRSGTGLGSVEVSIGQLINGAAAYWNGVGWGSSVEVWNPVSEGKENWRYGLDKAHLLGGGWYTLRARATDVEGRCGYSETRSFAYDNTMPATAGHVRLLDASSILVSFTKVVSGADKSLNYGISRGVSVIKVDKIDGKNYVLRLSQPLTAGLDYEMVLSHITDLAGNPLEEGSSRAGFQNHAPVAPGVNAPSNNGEVQSIQPTLSVSNASDLDGDPLTYTFEIFTDSGFTQQVASKSGVAEGAQCTEWQVETPLQEDKRYWWRSRAHDGVFQSAWCSSAFLVNLHNDPPEKPVVHYPPTGAHVPTQTPALEVHRATDPDSEYLTYEFQIFADEAGTVLIFEASGVLEGAEGLVSCTIPTALADNTLFHWRARARDDKGSTGPWTELTAFRVNTANDLPSAPAILHPADGQETAGVSPSLEISNATDADMDPLMYFFELDRRGIFTGPMTFRSSPVPEGMGNRTAWTLPVPLLDNTLYYWRARAYDGKGYGPWSRATFLLNKVNDPPETPRLQEPCAVEVQNDAPTLRVYAATDPDLDTITYRFEIFQDAALGEPIETSESQEEIWKVSKPLSPGTTYYWRACAVDEHGLASEWSTSSWFKTSSAGPVPGTPTVNNPVNRGMVVGLRATLSVVNASDALMYHFELYQDSQLKHLLDSAVVNRGESITTWAPDSTFKDADTYFWRCRGLNGVIPGPWMPTARFEVTVAGAKPEVHLEAKQGISPSSRGVTHIQVAKTGSALRGTRLEIPEGALSQFCEISIGVVQNPPALPMNTRYAGRVIDFGPDGTVFSKPVTVVMPLQREELEGMGVRDLGELRILTYVTGKMGWEEVPVEHVDNENLLVTFKVSHFSMYVAVKETTGQDPVTAGGESGGGSGCFITTLDPEGFNRNYPVRCLLGFLFALVGFLLMQALGRNQTKGLRFEERFALPPTSNLQLPTSSQPARKFRSKIITLTALLAGLLFSPGFSLATTASISGSGSEGPITLSASASFSAYEENRSGTLLVYQGTSLIAQVPGDGSASWTTTMDGGLLPQGENTFTATAVDSRGLSHASSASIFIDNTPVVTVQSPGTPEGMFDITGTVQFKTCITGQEGVLEIYINTTDWRKKKYKWFEGTGITWTYSDVAGALLDAGAFANGEHIIRVKAMAANGAWTEWVEARFFVDNTPKVTVQGPGNVQGLFDITGTVQFKDYPGGLDGVLEIYIDTTDWRKKKYKWFEGTSITWTYSEVAGAMLDAGAFSNGEHKIYANAYAANGAWSGWAEASFVIDNTPTVTVQSPGNVEGLFDITGTAQFKDYPGGMEGVVELYIDTTSWRYVQRKEFEGTSITWTYSDVAGALLDAGGFSNGEHKIYANAYAANGAWSGWTEASFFVDNTPKVTLQSPGKRQGLVDIVGTANFKEYHGGKEGTVILNADSTHWKWELCTKSYEGTGITWSYSDMTGNKIDLSKWAPGKHKLYAMAIAANGAASEWVEAELEVMPSDGLARPYNLGAGAGPCECRPYSENPINFATGNKYHKETDFRLQGHGIPMVFRRHYNSQAQSDGPTGRGWSTTYSDRVTDQGDALLLTQADGREVLFEETAGGTFNSVTDELRIIEKAPGGYHVKDPDGTEYSFDSQGRLTMIGDRNGNSQILTYQDSLLRSVADNFGRRIDFTYNQDARLVSVSGPAGEVDFAHDSHGNLVEVTCLDGNKRRFLYEDTRYPQAMTGIIQEDGLRYATYVYDSEERAVLSKHAGDSKVVQVEYGPGLKRKLTDSLGRERTFDLQVTQGIGRIKTSTGSGCGSCPGEGAADYDLDARLRIETSMDGSGAVTVLTHDSRGNVLTRTEAYGTPEQRTLTFTYHDEYNIPTSLKRQSLSGGGKESVVLFEYDERGNLLKKTESGFDGATSLTRSVIYTYDEHGRGLSVDGPREDVNDVAVLEYYPNTLDQGFDRGMLKKIQNALGNETTFHQYNGFGSPGRIVGINGTVTLLGYDLRGRLVSKIVNDQETRYTYDALGNLVTLALPGGRVTSFTYNEINLLERVQDQQGNYILYAYDTEGNRIKEEVHDKNGALKRVLNAQYDDYNRLKSITYPDGASETTAYDEVGNVTTRTDPNGQQLQHTYDILRRLLTITEPGDLSTRFTYDGHDHLVSVTDARNNTTTYTYDDLGRLLRTNSPDTNQSSYTYDATDNLLSSTDGRGITTTYQYDALNRLKRIEQPDASESITFNHDEGTGGKGRVTSMVDPTGRSEYTYDELGRLATERRTMEGTVYTTQYAYDGNGSLVAMTYPSGLVVEYQRDGAGRISGVKVNGQTLAGDTAYLPFGPLSSRTLGSNLLSIAHTHDQRYQLKAIQAGPLLDYQYTHDPAGNITAISGVTEPSPAGETRQYEYTANLLTTVTSKDARQYTYDGAGNIISDGVFNFTYNHSGRLVRVTKGGDLVAEYAYDGLARRVKKTIAGSTTVFYYDKQANLIAETKADGTPLRDIIYADGERIAMKLYGDQAGIYYFLNDHLGTPHMVIDATGQIVWHAAYLPFGQAQILTEKIPNHFRFPGQYYDPETGLHYNYFRYYDPSTGRYLTPDPLGLIGGVNLYRYALSNPAIWVDSSGLSSGRVHGVISADVLSGYTTNQSYIDRVVEGNQYVDRLTNTFNNNQHGMRDIGQSRFDAMLKCKEFQNRQMELALEAARNCDFHKALFELGQGLHSVQDEIAHDYALFFTHLLNPLFAPSMSYRDPFPEDVKYQQAVIESKRYVERFVRALGSNPFK
ncbi:MAG: RHS repeat-associated core domain-containing protein [Thermodesulfobacteriota bacterium]